MAASSPEASAGASNPAQAGLRAVAAALAGAPLDRLAAALGKDETTACRVRSEDSRVSVSDAVRLLYACGLKVVPQTKVCVDRAKYEAMVVIASAAMADEQTARRLTWDES